RRRDQRRLPAIPLSVTSASLSPSGADRDTRTSQDASGGERAVSSPLASSAIARRFAGTPVLGDVSSTPIYNQRSTRGARRDEPGQITAPPQPLDLSRRRRSVRNGLHELHEAVERVPALGLQRLLRDLRP